MTVLCKVAAKGVPCPAATLRSAFGPLAVMVAGGKCDVYSDEGVAFRNRHNACPFKAVREPVIRAASARSKLNPLKAAKRAQRGGAGKDA